MKYTAFALLFFWPALLSAKQTKPVKVLKATATTVARKNSVIHVITNIPKGFVSVARIVTDTGEYVTGKIHDGFVKLDSLADEYVEGQAQ